MSHQQLEQSVVDLRQQLQHMKVLQNFTQTLSQQGENVSEILWNVSKDAVAHLDLEDCVIYLHDLKNGELVQCSAYGPKNPYEREILNPIRLRLGQGIVGSVAASGKLEMIADTSKDLRYITDDKPRLSELAVPIFVNDKVVGVIDSEHTRVNFFTPEHRDLFVALAAMVGSRIGAARFEEERLRLAKQDPLTGLDNRGSLMSDLQRRLEETISTVAVIYIDLDHFGDINHVLGDVESDKLLRAISESIQSNASPGSLCSRVGGDEFVVVFDGDFLQAKIAAEKLLNGISKSRSVGLHDKMSVNCSIGVSMGSRGNIAADIINQADFAQSEAKRKGRGQLCVHDSVLANRRRREQRVAMELRLALESGGKDFFFHIQPIFSFPQRKIVAGEVLARWTHPEQELGVIGPTEFVQAAERTGNISNLSQLIFSKAQGAIERWKVLVPDFLFHINVSPMQIQQDQFVPDLLRVLESAQIPTSMIACEVTESALMTNDAIASEVLNSIVRHGMKLILDDFGTGYASYDRLRRYRFTGIKIDQRFVKGLLHFDSTTHTIVNSMLLLARDMQLTCTAEGVETPAQIQALENMGCTLMQGNGLCTAISEQVFEDLITPKLSVPQ